MRFSKDQGGELGWGVVDHFELYVRLDSAIGSMYGEKV